MGDPVTHFEINSSDPERARTFYSDVFTWLMKPARPANYKFADPDAGGIGIWGGIGPKRLQRSFMTLYISVRDLDETLRKVVASGGTVIAPPYEPGTGTWIAHFTDPDGNIVSLLKAEP